MENKTQREIFINSAYSFIMTFGSAQSKNAPSLLYDSYRSMMDAHSKLEPHIVFDDENVVFIYETIHSLIAGSFPDDKVFERIFMFQE